jgi:hypothetical protein
LRHCITIIIAASLLSIPIRSWASNLFADVGVQTRYVQGDSTYYISGVDPALGSWASELEFPLNNSMAGVSLYVGSSHEENPRQVKGQFCLVWLTTIDDDAGTMKDSDWIENDAAYGEASHAGKDMYTESDARVQGTIFDVDYAHYFRFGARWSLGPMIGYRSQKFEYEIYGYRGTYWTTPVSGAGKALDYEITYKIPYIGLSSGLFFGQTNQFELWFTFAYSNWVKAEDRDDHVLRYKLSEGDCEGNAYLINLSLDWNLYPNWILGLGAEYSDIDTTGAQHQQFYAGPFVGTTYDVDDKISSSSFSTIVKISYAF